MLNVEGLVKKIEQLFVKTLQFLKALQLPETKVSEIQYRKEIKKLFKFSKNIF